ncbi:MAG: TldD/PmbA family protein [Myxococcales bacterium]|nr:TldD/PmbA family protein [Myxococcales bacterium]MCB9549570.1 TldD/PmbA family protein [Myxococcales bacterium]
MLQAAHAAAARAKAHGADEAKVVVSRSRGVDLEWRDGRLERVQERTRRSLSVEIFVDGRYSASSTNDLRPEALEAFFADAVAMTRLLEKDPHRCLPDPAAYAGRADVDLDLVDPGYGAVSSAERRQVVEELEALVRAADPDLPIISVSTEVSDTWSQSARVHTNGFEGAREGTSFVLGAMVTVKDADGRRPMGWDYTVRRHRSDLDSPGAVAQAAASRARAQLGAGKLPTGRYPIVLVNRAVPRLLGAFLGPLNGPALQQKQSLWDGRLGEAIASPLLTIYDEPHRVRGLGSALWDGDGFATHRRPLLEGGILRTFFIDHYYGLKMGVAPTGGDTHNLAWTLGNRDLDGLIADVGEGVLIDRFLGGNSNGTSGEFSFGCAGRVIRGGQLAEPVAEVNLAGNLDGIWKQLVAVGNDPDPNSGAACPSCVLDGVQLSGQ